MPAPVPGKAHGNAFGVLRLVLAALVIVSHSAEMLDGNRSRELLTRMFGTISFGEFAVDGFFIVSGSLVTASFVRRPKILSYLWRRIVRIYPAFIAATLVCILVVAPLGGVDITRISQAGWKQLAIRALTLEPVNIRGVFAGQPYASLNSAMWTIAYEFRCYLLVLILGVTRALKRPWIVVGLAACCLLVPILMPVSTFAYLRDDPVAKTVLVNPLVAARLAGQFLAGACFFLFGRGPRPTMLTVGLALVGLCVGLSFKPTAEPAVAIFGGYLIFAIAFQTRWRWLNRINDKDDVSYGLYLYAWPVAMLLIRYWAGISLGALMLATLVGALAMGAVSWFAVEKPVLARFRGKAR
ncbi:acyltransferase family protein [Sphingomonas sp. Leaf17]|uniref:acyltransferase family protein n=1 Tax=Sphingomonas sp. Leaf17 TaxID=1735683 RepID=UPI00138F2CF0|nr:acyltransferase [Sphingomonas sp. Leaf17]